VLATIDGWLVDVVTDYARLVEPPSMHGPSIGMPHARAMGQGLLELRPRGRSRAGRALYCFVHDQQIIIAHAFLKKTRTTPGHDLAIARQRTKEIQRG